MKYKFLLYMSENLKLSGWPSESISSPPSGGAVSRLARFVSFRFVSSISFGPSRVSLASGFHVSGGGGGGGGGAGVQVVR